MTHPIPTRTRVTALGAASILGCAPGPAGESLISAVQDRDGASLGSVALPPTSCRDSAETHLRRGLALLHNMTYTRAEAAFRRAAEEDPNCPLAAWGVAMSLIHPLWPATASTERINTVAQRLLADTRARVSLSEHENAYFTAVEEYYREAAARSERERLASWAAGWNRVAATYPADLEAQLFRALSQMGAAQTAEDGKALRIQAGEIAEDVLARVPDHTGALHYIIHAYDAPGTADRALAAARTYGKIAPENSHALHMTSHIFTRLGMWVESIEYNQRAATAALGHPVNGMVSHHYLHAADYLVYAMLQRGDDAEARKVSDALDTLASPVVPNMVSAYPLAAVPARMVLERQDWPRAASLTRHRSTLVDWDAYPHLEAMTEFAIGIGAARTGRPAADRLDALAVRAAALPGTYDWGTQVRVQALAVRAWSAFAAGNRDEALRVMREAKALEASTDKHAITPGEVLPAAELLGDMLLELEQYDEARTAYDAALDRTPNRLNSLYGAGRAAELAGDQDAAAIYYEQIRSLAVAESDAERVQYAVAALRGT